MGATGGIHDEGQPVDTANGIASGAAHNLKEQQLEPSQNPNDHQDGMEIDPKAPS